MFKWLNLFLLGITTLFFFGCQQHEPEQSNTIKIGTMAGPETELMEIAKKVAKERYDLNIIIVPFNSYMMPNAALSDGSLDANMFQDKPFLDAQIKAKGYKITPIGKTFIYPMGIYSDKLRNLAQIKNGASVAIPNDPSNEGRALLLLQHANLIKLKPNVGYDPTPLDIADNPKHLKFVPIEAAQLPRTLNDVSIAVINTNYAMPAGLDPEKNALYVEGKDSPYANIVVVRDRDKDDPKFHKLMESLHSKPVLIAAKRIFGSGAIPAWKGAPSMKSLPDEEKTKQAEIH